MMMIRGLRILIVEDQYLVAASVRKAVESEGGVVVGQTRHLNDAVTLFEKKAFDLALLDINLGDETTYAFAASLDELNVPYVFVSGYDREAIAPHFRDRPRLQKPFSPKALQEAIAKCLQKA